MKQAIVVFDSCAASLKFGAYLVDSAADPGPALSPLCVGRIEGIDADPHFARQERGRQAAGTHQWGAGHGSTTRLRRNTSSVG